MDYALILAIAAFALSLVAAPWAYGRARKPRDGELEDQRLAEIRRLLEGL